MHEIVRLRCTRATRAPGWSPSGRERPPHKGGQDVGLRPLPPSAAPNLAGAAPGHCRPDRDDLTDEVGRLAGCTDVVDLGSGQGYLSRTLAFQYNWSVVAVEGRENNVAASYRIDATVQKAMKKRLGDERGCAWVPGSGRLRHVTAHVQPTISAREFWDVVDEREAGGGPKGGAEAEGVSAGGEKAAAGASTG
eukprot:2179353-Prymnesium_polylepis.1